MESKPSKTSKIELSHQQRVALVELLKGGTDAAAAKAAGVNRSTVNSWRLFNPLFILEYRQQSNAITEATLSAWQDQMKEATQAALTAVTAACNAGDINTSKWLLDKSTALPEAATAAYLQIVTKPVIKSEDVNQIIREIAEREVSEATRTNPDFEEVDLFENAIEGRKRKAVNSLIAQLQKENGHLYDL